MSHKLEEYGPWAIVTGASSGIGEAFARLLAAESINLILVARRLERLDALGAQLAARYGVDTRSVGVDLSKNGAVKQIQDAASGLDVGLVVSNAGNAIMGKFVEISQQGLEEMIHLNINSHMELAHHFGSRMANERSKGGLLLVSSTAAFQGVPYIANYAAAKSYVLNLGEALNSELKDSGIHVSVLVPGPTDTEMVRTPDANFDQFPMPFMSAKQAAQSGLKGLLQNKAYVVPGTLNRIMSGFMGRRILSRGANVSMWGALMKRAMVPQSDPTPAKAN